MNCAAPRISGADRSLALAGLVLLAGTVPVAAQLSPNGGEFQVNTYTTSDQRVPAVACDTLGNCVVAWESYGSTGNDAVASSIQVQRYDRTGAPLGVEVQVNTYTIGSQVFPAVARDPEGNFVVVWQSSGSTGADFGSYGILGQRFNNAGAAVGGEFQVNSYTTGDQRLPAIASDALGNFVVAWQSLGSGSNDTSSFSIHARRFDVNGTPIGSELQVNTYTTNEQQAPAVASDALGNFIVTWESYGSAGTDQSNWSVQAQRYDANASPVGSQFQVNSYTTSVQRSPAVGADAPGNFFVVWESVGSIGNDASTYGIQGQRFDPNGLQLGSQFQVNTYTTSFQRYPAVAADAQGEFVIAWDSFGSSGPDASDWSVQMQRYDPTGTPLGGEVQVNSYTTSSQFASAVTRDGRGNFVVAWQSLGSSGTDSDSLSVHAQLYDGLFRDGFETGNTSRWSATAP